MLASLVQHYCSYFRTQAPVSNGYKSAFISRVRWKRNYICFSSLSKRYKHNLYDKHVASNWHINNSGMLNKGYITETGPPSRLQPDRHVQFEIEGTSQIPSAETKQNKVEWDHFIFKVLYGLCKRQVYPHSSTQVISKRRYSWIWRGLVSPHLLPTSQNFWVILF